MLELRDIVIRLRQGDSVKSIHRDSGRHKTVIRRLKAIAVEAGWLHGETPPTEEHIHRVWAAEDNREKEHPLNRLREDLKRWYVDAEYSFVVIHRLVAERGLAYSETTIRRYLKQAFPRDPKPIIRRDHPPGKTMEVDFGFLGLVYDEDERRNRKAWVFSGRLARSRKTYRERVWTQKKEVFFACHEHAFRFYRGVPAQVVPDNLKAAVVKASFTEPEVNREYRALAEHYGFLVSPCLPGKPEHKGGVENDIKFVKGSFWPLVKERERQRGHEVPFVSAVDRYLTVWNREVSETRVVGGTGRTVIALFEEEAPRLKPLPMTPWVPIIYRSAKVSFDYHLQFDKAFYSVPYRYIGKTVLVMATANMVRIFFEYKEIALHRRARKPWERVSNEDHGPPERAAFLETTAAGLKRLAYEKSESLGKVVDAILARKAVDGLRPARGVLSLSDRYPLEAVTAACDRCLSYDEVGYRTLKTLLARELPAQPVFAFARPAGYFDVPAEVRHG